ncbi:MULTISPECIES: hypothetical protein [unclassified Curtobacterium]|uniref:hypothetical protein n=1 Tax=unclassified Curtobacterium TaxID=257496 RepID=UPI000AA1A22D|nr:MULTISPECIES: hypothetical protein [unclassified Curtobacterium]WIA96647.1 hypothetical protein QOL16_16365 [Curtobacterium sp. MCBA15_004]WIA99952.1 hypothetical protein QOL15_15805 [Curtobacterium sp. MCBA15_012]
MTDTLSVPTLRPARVGRPTRATRASRPTPAAVRTHGETAPRWMRVVGAVLLLGGGALTAAVLDWPGEAPEVALLVPGVVALVAGALLLLARTGIAVTDTEVVLRFRPLPPRHIARRSIAAVAVVEADATTFGGVGLRLGRGVRALLLTPGRGVRITDDRGRVTFVRTDDAQRVRRALEARPGA